MEELMLFFHWTPVQIRELSIEDINQSFDIMKREYRRQRKEQRRLANMSKRR